MGEVSGFHIGQTVELHDGRIAAVRFAGTTHFAPGDWLGVELEDNSGKNDGSLQGQRYFDCEPGYGMFVRPGVATVLEETTSQPVDRRANGSTEKLPEKPGSKNVTGGLRRQTVGGIANGKRASINTGSSMPSGRAVGALGVLRSPSKSPTKQLSSRSLSRPSSGIGASRNTVPPTASTPSLSVQNARGGVGGQLSMGPPQSAVNSRPSRLSTVGAAKGPPRLTGRPSVPGIRKPNDRLAALQMTSTRSPTTSGDSQASERSSQDSPVNGPVSKVLSPQPSDNDATQVGRSPPLSHNSNFNRNHVSSKPSPSLGKVSPPERQRTLSSTTVQNRENEDLKAKLRLIEKKRMEDRDKLKSLEKIQAERDKFEAIIQKLQDKFQPQQQELSELRKRVKDAEANAETIAFQQGETDTIVEMATIDREMAEETAESLRNELDALRQKHEELELEVEILKEENLELGKEMSPEERTSQGWMQMERSNERLREALLRLRDVTQEQEVELRQQIKELEKDAQSLRNVEGRYEERGEKLAKSETTIEELRQQLEVALTADEMIEELTERNTTLTERIDDLQSTIEDLENLKELNDELEINHIETEKQMQDEIDYKDTVVQEHIRRSGAQDEAIEDLEYTVSRFRELVASLQSDLKDMRASQQITETEASELSDRSRAMLDLNMKLQMSASKAQVKAMDLELRRLEAQESAEHLAILQLFLPESFHREHESINALLRFKRIGFKSSLLHGFIRERANGSSALPGQEDVMIVYCDIVDKLVWISALCERFGSFISGCSQEVFGKLGSAAYDLEPVERALNAWIDGLKRDELKEELCAADLQRSIALMLHLAETYIGEGLQQHAEDIRMRALMMQSNLESTTATLSHVKSLVPIKAPATVDDDGDNEVESLLSKFDSLTSQLRSAKVVTSKAIGQLEELQSRSLTLDPSTLPAIEALQASTSEMASACRQSGFSLFNLVTEEGRTSAVTYDEIRKAISPADSSPLSTLSSNINFISGQMHNFFHLTTTLSQTVEFPPPASPPWELIAQDLRTASTTSALHEEEVGRLKDELVEKNTALAMRDNVVEEMAVNVEVLEKRIADSAGRREKLRELEMIIEGLGSKSKEATRRIARLEEDLRMLEVDRDHWKDQVSRLGNQAGSRDASSSSGSASNNTIPERAQAMMERLKAEISLLQSTIRHLRLSKFDASLSAAHSFLSEPLLPKPVPSAKIQLAYESKDVLRSLLSLVTRPENGVVELKLRKREERLAWRPVRESARWQVSRQQEEWEVWREWRDDVARRRRDLGMVEERRRGRQGRAIEEGKVLASVDVRLPMSVERAGDGKGRGMEVRIVRPGEWEDLERGLGVGLGVR